MKKISIGIALISLFACGGKNEQETVTKEINQDRVELNEAQAKQAAIVCSKPVEQELSGQIRVNGVIDVPPQNMVSISIPLGGYLEATKLLPGMHIQKGEVIAVMEDQQYIQLQQEYLQAKASMQFLEKELTRQKELNASKASSDKVFQQTQRDYENARVSLKGLEEKLLLIGIHPEKLSTSSISRRVSLRSPIDGFVSKVHVNIGKYVSPTEVLFDLVNPEDIHLNLTVFEPDLPALYIGQRVTAFTNAHPDKKYPGEIILIGKDLGPERFSSVHCHFDKYDKSLVPGTYMNAMITLAKRKVAALPDEAIVMHDGRNAAFIKNSDGSYELVFVKTGLQEKGYTELDAEANKSLLDKEFVVKGAYTLLMKLKNAGEEE